MQLVTQEMPSIELQLFYGIQVNVSLTIRYPETHKVQIEEEMHEEQGDTQD